MHFIDEKLEKITRANVMLRLPDVHPQTIRTIQFVSGLHPECFIKIRAIDNRSVYSFFSGRMDISH